MKINARCWRLELWSLEEEEAQSVYKRESKKKLKNMSNRE